MAINVSLMLPISIITTTKKTLPLCHSIPLLFTTGQLWIATPWSLITGLGINGIYRHIDPKILRLSHILYYIPLFNAAYLNLTHLPKQNTDAVVLTTLCPSQDFCTGVPIICPQDLSPLPQTRTPGHRLWSP